MSENEAGQNILHCGGIKRLQQVVLQVTHPEYSQEMQYVQYLLVCQARSSVTCTPRNLNEDAISTQVPLTHMGAWFALLFIQFITLGLLVFSKRLFA